MASKMSQEEFISKAMEVHGDRYGLGEVVYRRSIDKVKVLCPVHGYFESEARRFIAGRGCRRCANHILNSNKRLNKLELLTRLRKLYRNTLYYSLSGYENVRTPISVYCAKHEVDIENVLPLRLLNNHTPCRQCVLEVLMKGRKSWEDLEKDFKKVHGDKYTYDESSYVKTSKPISITCADHGVFRQTPSNHRKGAGCPKCAKYGFNESLPAFIYLLKSDTGLIKVGITNNSVEGRARRVSSSSGESFYPLWSFYTSFGYLVKEVETEILDFLKKNFKQPQQKFEGSTETFIGMSESFAINLLIDTCKEMEKC